MILVQQRESKNNKDGILVQVDQDRAVAVWENGDALWINTKNGEQVRSWVLQRDTAEALVVLLCEKLGIEL